MRKADSLSRRSDWEKDNKERILLKPEWLEVRMGEVIVEGVNILEKIRKSEAKDNDVIKVGVKMLRNEKWKEEDGYKGDWGTRL